MFVHSATKKSDRDGKFYFNKSVAHFIVSVIMLASSGCDWLNSPPQNNSSIYLPSPEWQASDVVEPQSKAVKVHVYIDATTSMKGYVKENIVTQYMATIQNIESAISSGWQKPEIIFYKFGSWIKPLTGRQHIHALTPEFYQENGISAETEMDKVLKLSTISANGNLSVIITDLFQKDSDVPLLTNMLKDNCLQKGIALGVMGIKSQFAGNIHDVGIRGDTYKYSSTESDQKSYRPFYILVMGKHSDVVNFYEKISSKLPFISREYFSLFSHYLVNPLATFEGSVRSKAVNLNPTEQLTKVTSPKIKQLRLLDESSAAATYTVPLSTVRYSPQFGNKPPVFEVSGEDFENGKKVSVSDGLIVESASISGDKLSIPIKIKPGSLNQGHSYRFRLTGFPAKDSYQPPGWWSQWNLNIGDVVSKKTNIDGKIDGGKTQNLSLFMTSLWESNAVNTPKIFESYLYISTRH